MSLLSVVLESRQPRLVHRGSLVFKKINVVSA